MFGGAAREPLVQTLQVCVQRPQYSLELTFILIYNLL